MPLPSLPSFSRFFCGDAANKANADTGSAKRERRKQARPGELLDAALALFVEKGFAATRVEEVAARAGVSKGTLFLYFSSKEELFKAVVRENISGRLDEWADEFERFEGSSADMLGYCMHSWWQRIGATKASGIYKLMLCEGGNFPEIAAFYRREVVEPGHLLIGRILKRGMASGEFRPMDAATLDLAVISVVAPMIFLILSQHCLHIGGPMQASLDPSSFVTAQCQTLLYGWCLATPLANR